MSLRSMFRAILPTKPPPPPPPEAAPLPPLELPAEEAPLVPSLPPPDTRQKPTPYAPQNERSGRTVIPRKPTPPPILEFPEVPKRTGWSLRGMIWSHVSCLADPEPNPRR